MNTKTKKHTTSHNTPPQPHKKKPNQKHTKKPQTNQPPTTQTK